jgi:hypothetical protein
MFLIAFIRIRSYFIEQTYVMCQVYELCTKNWVVVGMEILYSFDDHRSCSVAILSKQCPLTNSNPQILYG